MRVPQVSQLPVGSIYVDSLGIKLIGFTVRLSCLRQETLPSSSVLLVTRLAAIVLAQTLISSGILFIMINAEMMNGNANASEVAQPSAGASLIPFPLVNRSLSLPGAAIRGAHGCGPGRLPERTQAGLDGTFLPIRFYSSFAEYLLGSPGSNIFPAGTITNLGQ